MKYIDPTGLYVCEGTDSECASFATALESLRVARDTFTPDTGEYKRLDASIASYGNENVNNGVSVSFGPVDSGRAAETVIRISGNNMGSNTNLNGQDIAVTFMPELVADNFELAVQTAHEGDHVVGGSALTREVRRQSRAVLTNRAWNPTVYDFETTAYQVSSFAVQGLNLSQRRNLLSYSLIGAGRQFEIWNKGWRSTDMNRRRNAGIRGILGTDAYKNSRFETVIPVR